MYLVPRGVSAMRRSALTGVIHKLASSSQAKPSGTPPRSPSKARPLGRVGRLVLRHPQRAPPHFTVTKAAWPCLCERGEAGAGAGWGRSHQHRLGLGYRGAAFAPPRTRRLDQHRLDDHRPDQPLPGRPRAPDERDARLGQSSLPRRAHHPPILSGSSKPPRRHAPPCRLPRNPPPRHSSGADRRRPMRPPPHQPRRQHHPPRRQMLIGLGGDP